MQRVLICLLVIFSSIPVSAQKARSISVNELETLLASKKDVVLLDVRTNDELKEHGMIAGAKQIDYFAKDFEKQLLSLDKNQTYVVYCASGVRSGEAVEFLSSNGFGKIYDLPAGFNGWKKSKKPVQQVNR